MTKVAKITSIVLIVMMVIAIAIPVFAVDPAEIKAIDTTAGGTVKTLAGQILSIVQIVATSVAVIMLVVLGTKYITASATDKAEIKKSATGYIIGAVILFAATGLLQIIKTFADNIKG